MPEVGVGVLFIAGLLGATPFSMVGVAEVLGIGKIDGGVVVGIVFGK